LRQEYKVQAELSDMYNVLFLITLGDGRAEVEYLVAALKALAEKYRKKASFFAVDKACFLDKHPKLPKQIMSPRDALFGQTEKVPFSESAGLVCAEIITFYPPGIPQLCPGEQISKEIIDYCRRLLSAGLHITGPEDNLLNTIKVAK
jgi:arginine decarboxylase